MKKIFVWFLILLLSVIYASSQVTFDHDKTFFEITDYYNYTNVTDCVQLANISSNLNGNYELGNDIECEDYGNWIPLGNNTHPFSGRFEGNGYKISNINITSAKSHLGLFGYLSGAEVFRLEIENISVTQTGTCAYDEIGCWLCEYTYYVPLCTAQRVGGLFGSTGNSNVSQILVSGNINGLQMVGMLGGYSDVSTTINNIVTHGVVEDLTHHKAYDVLIHPLAGGDSRLSSDSRGQIVGALGWYTCDYYGKWWQTDGIIEYAFTDVTYPNISEQNRTEVIFANAPFGNFGIGGCDSSPQVTLSHTASFSHIINSSGIYNITYYRDWCNRVKYYWAYDGCTMADNIKCSGGCFPLSNTTDMNYFKGDVSERQVIIANGTWVDQAWRFHYFQVECTDRIENYTPIWYERTNDTSELTLSAYDKSCNFPTCWDGYTNQGETDIDYGNERCGYCVLEPTNESRDPVWLSIPLRPIPFDFELCDEYENIFGFILFFLILLLLLFLFLLLLILLIIILYYWFMSRGILKKLKIIFKDSKEYIRKKRKV